MYQLDYYRWRGQYRLLTLSSVLLNLVVLDF